MAFMEILSTSIIFTSLALIFTLLLLIQINKKKLKKSQRKNVYHPVGGIFVQYLLNFNRLHDFFTDLAAKYKTFRILSPFRNEIFTADPLIVEYILKTNFKNYGKGHYNSSVLRDIVGEGIFSVDGEKWLQQRKISSYEFSSKMMKDFHFAAFKNNAAKLANVVSEVAKLNRSIDIQDLFMKSILDSILEIAFGDEFDTLSGLNDEATKFSKAFDDAMESILWRYGDELLWSIKKFLNIGCEASLKKNMKLVFDFVSKLINTKIEQIKKLEDDFCKKKQKDMISRFIQVTGTDSIYLRDMVLNFIVAVKDTSSVTLSWFIYMLCKNPSVQAKIAEELKKVIQIQETTNFVDFADIITEESLEKMNYLQAAITETLRLYPAVPLNSKDCLSDDVLPDGFTVKKGDMVVYLPYAMGRMKFLWGDDAEEYKPERWLNNDGLVRRESPFKFTAFQAGPRMCVGKEFAYKQMKMFSAVLLSFFSFKLCDERETVDYKTMLTLHINQGLHVCAVSR